MYLILVFFKISIMRKSLNIHVKKLLSKKKIAQLFHNYISKAVVVSNSKPLRILDEGQGIQTQRF